MHRSTDRILTTHVGALQRPPELTRSMHEAQDQAENVDQLLTDSVLQVVRKQAEVGIDIVDDGEFGKSIWMWYVMDRLTGFERHEFEAPYFTGRDRDAFPEFYAYADSLGSPLFYVDDQVFLDSFAGQPTCTGPINYRPEFVKRDIANLKSAMGRVQPQGAFLPVVAPASVEVGTVNKYYPNQEEYLRALTDAMKDEYRAIADSGVMLQVDDAWIPALWDRTPDLDMKQYRSFCQARIEMLNDALSDIPEEQIRYHICWGSWHGPHSADVPLAEIIDLILNVRASTFVFEAANPRHEHEYRIWEDIPLPEGKVIAPGVVTHSTNVVEHPELVAERITRFAERVGKENVLASTDCGFASRIHPELGWAKLEALSQGAELASQRLWR